MANAGTRRLHVEVLVKHCASCYDQVSKLPVVEEAMSMYWHAIRSFSPSLWRLFASLALVGSVSMGLQAVLLNLYLLRLGFEAPYIGLLAGLGQPVWAAAALSAG
jgi:hypothetical protein